jgi:hypothetical protein
MSSQQALRPGSARRRIATIVAGVVALVLLAVAGLLAADWDANVTAASFSAARGNQTTLRNFLTRMPKGADLHVHLSGAVYAERYIAWAAEDGLCLHVRDLSIVNPPCDSANGDMPMAAAARDQATYDRVVNAMSMRDFMPSAAEPSGHDHFFATFGKFSAATDRRLPDMVVDQLKYYQDQSAQYVELMTSFSWTDERKPLVAAIGSETDPALMLAALNKAGLPELVAKKKTELAGTIASIEKLRHCEASKTAPGCNVDYNFIAQVLRASPLNDVFVQTALAAALIRAEPRVVALNFVQPEDNAVARKDYSAHMRMIDFLAKDVPVALHAGELWLGLVPPDDLTFHIGEAVTVAGARRIGHGVSLAFEHDLDKLLAEMRKRPVAVEINLTSNDMILGVRGGQHPFPAYRAAGVPVVLSTDDGAVERIDLTNEYVRAARDYRLGYAELKALARASLLYSFLGETEKRDEVARFDRASAAFEHGIAARASLWQDFALIVEAAVSR